MDDQVFHVRSITLPSRLHHLIQIEEDLHKLRTPAASSKIAAIGNRLRELGNVYDSIEELLNLPCNQCHLAHPNQRKWVEEELDFSLRLLDLAGAVRDGLSSARENLQEVQFSLRRKFCGDVKSKRADRNGYAPVCPIKKTVAKTLRSLQKQAEKSNRIADLCSINSVIVETREISISLLQAAFSVMAMVRMEPKASRWSLVRKALNKKKIASEEYEIGMGEEAMDAVCGEIQDLEAGLESLYRRLIQNRVSLLNVLSF